jgi:DNA-directed RNA polymerase subunit beta'
MSETKPALLATAEGEAEQIEKQYRRGLVTEDERLRELEVIWNHARDTLQQDVEKGLKGQNSVYMMATSGAKGNMNQISQMAGMRGLVLDPEGRIIDIPIRSNFREGLTVLEYFLSTHGARKGSPTPRCGRRTRLPDPATGRCGAGRDHHDRRLRHAHRRLDRAGR